MARIDELGLDTAEEEIIEIPEELPEESSGYIPLVQPGVYTLRLPEDLSTVWGKLNTPKGERISAFFGKDNPLIVEEDEFDGYYTNNPVTAFINNREWKRGRSGEEVADMTYLIAALEKHLPKNERSKLKTNMDFINALQRYAGTSFRCSVQWKAYCNPDKNIYTTIQEPDGTSRSAEQEGTFGCGGSYNTYTRDITQRIPSDTNGFMERFEETLIPGVECPAVLLAQINLSRFHSAVK